MLELFSERSELFSEKQWLGEFFVPSQQDNRFSGTVNYTPENGIILSYLISGHEMPPSSKVVFGNLDNGHKCTLVGEFPPADPGLSYNQGSYNRFGKVAFTFLLIGGFIDYKELFFGASFSLTNMQEFFFADKNSVELSDKPIVEVSTDYGSLSIIGYPIFSYLRDTKTRIYNDNQIALYKLEREIEVMKKIYPNSHFRIKDDIDSLIRIKFDNGLSIGDFYSHINDIVNLFAILLYQPVCPGSIYIENLSQENALSRIGVYTAPLLFGDSLKLSTEKVRHYSLPINNDTVDLSSILLYWLSICKDHSTIVASIKYMTTVRSIHSIHGEIVLYATLLESISSIEGQAYSGRYEYPVKKYGKFTIQEELEKILRKAKRTDIGVGIGTLRDEIAHAKKPKTILNLLSNQDLERFSHCLQMTIIGYVLSLLGINEGTILAYQKEHTPPV